MSPEPSNEPPGASLATALEQSRRLLMDAIAGLDEAAFRARPAGSERSAAEVLAHLLITEDQALALLGGTARETPEDEGRLAQRMVVPQIIHGLLARRRDCAQALGRLSEADMDRVLRHASWGELRVAALFQRLAEHESEHAEALRVAKARTAAPAV